MLLEVKNLKKYFPVKKGFKKKGESIVKAVDDVSLSVEQGESLSIVGESGCGKTTLARMIMRLYACDQGEIIFEKKPVHKLKGKNLRDYRSHVQMVFQDPYSSLDPRFSIRRIIREGMTLDNGRFSKQQEQELRLQELLRAVNLKPQMLDRYPHEFSGGERQRIAIARALALNPKLVILDEAISSLDVIIQQQILKLLKDLQRQLKLTYVFISHNLKAVRKVSNRIAVMYKGRIVELASVENIFENPQHEYTKGLLKAAVEYKVTDQQQIVLTKHSRLVDITGNGHFVLKG